MIYGIYDNDKVAKIKSMIRAGRMVDKGRCQLQVGQFEERTKKGDMPKMWREAEMSKAQGVTTCCSLAAGLRGNVERMRKWSENEEMKRERGNGVRERILRKNKEMERE